jgi:hypothetical protein
VAQPRLDPSLLGTATPCLAIPLTLAPKFTATERRPTLRVGFSKSGALIPSAQSSLTTPLIMGCPGPLDPSNRYDRLIVNPDDLTRPDGLEVREANRPVTWTFEARTCSIAEQ